MPRDEKFRKKKAATGQRTLRQVQTVSEFHQDIGPGLREPLIHAFKFTRSGVIENVRVDIGNLTGDATVSFALQRSGTNVAVTQHSVAKKGSTHLGNFDIQARDSLFISLVLADEEVSAQDVFVSYDYRR